MNKPVRHVFPPASTLTFDHGVRMMCDPQRDKDRAQFVSNSEMKSLMRSSEGISTLVKKRLCTPLLTLGCLFNRIPSNLDFKHRSLCMRTLRSDLARGEPGKWDCLPSQVRA